MKNLAGATVWLLLAAVLAAPSFLFYNWWAKNKEKAVLERAQKMNSGAVFQSRTAPEARDRPGSQSRTAPEARDRPGSQSRTAPEATGTPEAEASVRLRRTKSQEETGVSTPAQSMPAMAPGMSAPSKISAQAVLSSAAAFTAADVSTQLAPTSYFSPKSQRDPTISPMEYQRIKDKEYHRAETERQKLAAEKKRERETGIESKLHFQGVVGNFVIINGDMYNAGQKIFGAKILKVGTDYFIGEYKGKQFRKVLR